MQKGHYHHKLNIKKVLYLHITPQLFIKEMPFLKKPVSKLKVQKASSDKSDISAMS